ncbi:MAG: Lrp/AsnC family transcriptional regulator [Albidovulum sp.]|nr:Lrp/AsnC family transcriptional regulator [Albidovulum sp.]MDE0304088.1 Lrp/AsnC family transcriptional regulator [Albidovulum sp.]MDE0533355.1 Lrp/AsnC family transcriptional regulator [Albidovulum sp.]
MPPDLVELDDTDRHILKLLAENADIACGEIGRRISISQSVAWRRIQRLKESGILGKRRLVFDNEALGFTVTVFLGIKLSAKDSASLAEFERAITAIPEVQVVQHVLGIFDYRVRIVARNLSDFERVLRRRIMALPGISEFEANVLLSEERRRGPIG